MAARLAGAALAAFTLMATPAGAMTVTEEILEILKASGGISEAKYKELQQRLAQEGKGTPATPAAPEPVKVDPNRPVPMYRDGFRLESPNGLFSLRIGGRVYTDFGIVGADEELQQAFSSGTFGTTPASNPAPHNNDIEGHGVVFRQARINLEGSIYDNFIFQNELEFGTTNGSNTIQTQLRNVWLGARDVPYVGQIRVGHLKEPFSLEEVTTDYFITFMERSLPNALNAVYNTGIRLNNAFLDQRLTYGLGAFIATSDQSLNQSRTAGNAFRDTQDTNLTLRLTGLPWYEGRGEQLVHLGAGYQHRFREVGANPNANNALRFRSRPETILTEARLVDTGPIFADSVDTVNLELAGVYGPVWLAGEYSKAFVNADAEDNTQARRELVANATSSPVRYHSVFRAMTGDDPEFEGYYAQLGWFITGETRPYAAAAGSFGRVRPLKNFSWSGEGLGAFEVAGRWSRLDLDDTDAGIDGGVETNYTLGLNWYFNPAVRWQLNYIHATVDDRDLSFVNAGGTSRRSYDLDSESANIFATRFQIDF